MYCEPQALNAILKKFEPSLHLDPNAPRDLKALQDWCKQRGVSVFDPSNTLLAEIDSCPGRLFVMGDVELLSGPCIAIVGSRKAHRYGMRVAHYFASRLARAGCVVVSGLAHGIDSVAHQAAIEAGGKTVAVMAHGLDRIYPARNRGLARLILSKKVGAIVSEYPPGVPPYRQHFPQRNRIISGLSLGTLVVQASEKSGSLITARFALEQNREVFVAPGLFDDEAFAGGHAWIQCGAKLVRTVEDILDELPQMKTMPCPEESPPTELIKLFQTWSGELSLQALVDLPESKKILLLNQLSYAQQMGWVRLLSPQRYAWVGSPCQIDSDCEE